MQKVWDERDWEMQSSVCIGGAQSDTRILQFASRNIPASTYNGRQKRHPWNVVMASRQKRLSFTLKRKRKKMRTRITYQRIPSLGLH